MRLVMNILVNGEPTDLPTGTTLAELVARRGLSPEAVASAVEGRHVPRAARAARVLAEGESVTLFQPIVGG
jgi:sulfur carrier protein